MDFDIVRQSARVVPLRRVNKQFTSVKPALCGFSPFTVKSLKSRVNAIRRAGEEPFENKWQDQKEQDEHRDVKWRNRVQGASAMQRERAKAYR